MISSKIFILIVACMVVSSSEVKIDSSSDVIIDMELLEEQRTDWKLKKKKGQGTELELKKPPLVDLEQKLLILILNFLDWEDYARVLPLNKEFLAKTDDILRFFMFFPIVPKQTGLFTDDNILRLALTNQRLFAGEKERDQIFKKYPNSYRHKQSLLKKERNVEERLESFSGQNRAQLYNGIHEPNFTKAFFAQKVVFHVVFFFMFNCLLLFFGLSFGLMARTYEEETSSDKATGIWVALNVLYLFFAFAIEEKSWEKYHLQIKKYANQALQRKNLGNNTKKVY